MKVPISVTIITKNEAENIEACIQAALRVADEIIVVDSLSTDGTQQLCQILGAIVIERPFEGYVEQKNAAIDLASFDHILSLDADEILSESLIQSILAAKSNFTADAYEVNRLNNYCGQWIRHSGWYPDRKIRLFDRRKARWGGGRLHEHIVLEKNASLSLLEGDLLHYSYKNIPDHLNRINRYTDIMALAAYESGKKAGLEKVIFSPFINFNKRYFLKRGFLDGYYGFVIAIMGAYYNFMKYVKLRELQKEKEL
ncbi:MAG: glycosyltransferase family 2 protein [Bacteroidota bacterium]